MCHPNLKPSPFTLSVMILVILTAITCHCNQLGLSPPFFLTKLPCPTKRFLINSTGPHVATTRKTENNSSEEEFSIIFHESIERCMTSNVVAPASTLNAATSNCACKLTPQKGGVPAFSLVRKAISYTNPKSSSDQHSVSASCYTSTRKTQRGASLRTTGILVTVEKRTGTVTTTNPQTSRPATTPTVISQKKNSSIKSRAILPTGTRTKRTTSISSRKNKSTPTASESSTPNNTKSKILTTRSRSGNKGLMQIEELRMKNAEINNEARKKKATEEVEREKNEKACNIVEEASNKAALITPRNLHDVMNGNVEGINDLDDDDEIEAIMDIGFDGSKDSNGDTSEFSPVKKRSKGKRRSTTRPQISPPDSNLNESTAKGTSFLDEVVYSHSRIILELAIALKSEKVFEEFTQALMAFLTNAQMVDPTFVINPINPSSKEKNISNKGEISSNMTKLGTHVKISGNGNVFFIKRTSGPTKHLIAGVGNPQKKSSATQSYIFQ